MNCPKCNTPLMNGDMFCPVCGEKAPEQTVAYTPTPPPMNAQVYNAPVPPGNKSNTGLIVAIALAIVAVCVAIVAVFGGDFDGFRKNIAPQEDVGTYSAPVFDYVTGSSTRSYDVDTAVNQKVYYYSEYVMDDDMSTAWTPDRNIDPVPSITLQAREKQYVSGIRMTNGYCKSEKTYTKNRRISKARITYDGGETIAEFGMNHYREMIDIPFAAPVETDYITIQVIDSYYGEWKDIAISEIDVY